MDAQVALRIDSVSSDGVACLVVQKTALETCRIRSARGDRRVGSARNCDEFVDAAVVAVAISVDIEEGDGDGPARRRHIYRRARPH